MKKYITTTSILALLAGSTMAGTVINNKYYGGSTDASDVNGNIINNLDGGTEGITYGTYYGGNYYGMNPEKEELGQKAGDVLGDITNNLTNVTITGHYIGGNGNNDVSWSNFENGVNIGGVTGTITNNITNSSINGTFYAANLSGGPKTGYENGTIGALNTNITNSYVNWLCISGGGLINNISGNVNTVVKGSNINELYHNSGIYIGGDCNISFINSNVNTNYFYAAPSSHAGYTDNKIKGNLNVSLSGTSSVNGNLHMGAPSKNATVDGNVILTLTDTASVAGTIYGKEGNKFGGQTILNIGTSDAGYNGTKALSVSNFDTINVAETSKVTFASFDTSKNAQVLNVKGSVTTSDKVINIAEGGTLNLTIKESNQIDASVNNKGTFSVTASANLATGSYDIISGTLTGNNIIAFGGSVNGNIFTVAELQKVVLNDTKSAVITQNDRVVIADEAGEQVLNMAFNSTNAEVKSVTETTDSFTAHLQETLTQEIKAAEAYSFNVDMNVGDSVVLSFLVGDASLSAGNFTIYHKDGDAWVVADDVQNVVYDGSQLSFTVSHFSEYGFVAVPEPAEWAAIFGTLALGLVIYRRRK